MLSRITCVSRESYQMKINLMSVLRQHRLLFPLSSATTLLLPLFPTAPAVSIVAGNYSALLLLSPAVAVVDID